jgi:predicted DCC family thiol-disulfide oxidoreductase YuxK
VKPTNKAIVFFDGDCGLCNGSVRFLIRRDRHKRLYFAPLQGVAAQAILPEKYRSSLDTIVYQRINADGRPTQVVRSEAVLLALIDTGSAFGLLAHITRLIPTRLRDWCYRQIAANRKKFFKSAACQLRSKDEHARILP